MTMKISGLCHLGTVLAAAGTLALSTPAINAQTAGQPIRLSAWAVSMANVATGANGVLDIRIDKWSTDKEREQLIATFLDKGQEGLLKALQKVPVKGRIRIPARQGPDPTQTRLGWDLRFTMEQPGEDGGKRILFATDRFMSFAEVRSQPRTVDYPFLFAEVRLNKDGQGEGKMAVATQLKFDKKTNAIVFENYSTEPVRLQQVKVEK
jgi:hypothetical protein